MGGGNLNLKKSWHPSTLKNQERVWKAQQQDEMEKKKTQELQQELQHEREKEHYQTLTDEARGSFEKKNKMDWMYKGVTGLVDREDYLLGRKVDKTFDVIQAAEEQEKKQAENGSGDGLPSQLFRRRNDDTDFVAVDMACKVREDPLYLIRKQEYESKKQLLSNPVRMKMLQEMIAKEKSEKSRKSKKSKKKKKKKSSDIDSDLDEDDIDAKIAKYREKLLKSSSSREKNQDRGGSNELQSSRASSSRFRNSEHDSRDSHRRNNRSSPKRKAHSPETSRGRKPTGDLRQGVRDWQRYSRSPEQKRGNPRVPVSPERRKRPSSSPDAPKKASHSPDRSKSAARASRRPTHSRSPKRRREQRSVERRQRSCSPRRKQSSDNPNRGIGPRSSERKQNSTSPERIQDSRYYGGRPRNSQSPEREKHPEFETGSTRQRSDGFGLLKSSKQAPLDNGYEKKDYRTILEERMKKEDEERRELQRRLGDRNSRKMTREERERKLREMQEDAAAHEEERLECVKRHIRSDSIQVEGYKEGGFRGPEMLAKAVESSSVEMRLKIRRKGLQKSSRAMETNFLRK